jgi:hypothetical protein
MPALGVVGTFLASVGTTVTAGVVTSTAIAATIGGAVVGAATGALVAAVSGGDIKKGLIMGALSGASLGSLSAAYVPAAAVGGGTVSGGAVTGATSVSGSEAAAAGTLAAQSGASGGATVTAGLPAAATGGGAAVVAGGGPGMSFGQTMLAQGVLGAATAALDDSAEKEAEQEKWAMSQGAPYLGDLMSKAKISGPSAQVGEYDMGNGKERFRFDVDTMMPILNGGGKGFAQSVAVKTPTVKDPAKEGEIAA